MKKTVLLLLLALLVAVLPSCDEKKEAKDEDVSVADYGIGDIVEAAGLDRGVVYSTFTEEQKASLQETAAKWKDGELVTEDGVANAGVTVEFNEDGSTVFTYANGGVVTQGADGKISYATADAKDNTAGVNDSWPQNDYTAKLPVPNLAVSSVSEINGIYTVNFADASREAVVAYGNAIKEAGFTADEKVTDNEAIYSYEASDSEGNRVKLSYMGTMGSVSVELAVS